MTSEQCSYCRGNDKDMPCAYPGEGKPGCLRDARLSNQCGVKGCKNSRDQGAFVGPFCAPCDRDLRTGNFQLGTSVVYEQAREIERLRADLKRAVAGEIRESCLEQVKQRQSPVETGEQRQWVWFAQYYGSILQRIADGCEDPKALATAALNKPWSAQETSVRREYHARGTYWSGVPTIDAPCDFCHRSFMDHDPRTHACPSRAEVSQIVVGDSEYSRMQIQTPICTKCGQVDVRIPSLGIYHLCPEQPDAGKL